MAWRSSMAAMTLTAASSAIGQQWSVVALHPVGGWESDVDAVTATRQGGSYRASNLSTIEAGFWSGSAGSWTALTSPDPIVGRLLGMDNASQVGYYAGQAALWHGTPESYVNLGHPAGYGGSQANAVVGNMQVGMANATPGINHAALWRGTYQGFVDLHPAGASASFCTATDGVLQGGWIQWGGPRRATIWNGTAQSFLDLSPMPNTCRVLGMAPGVQVGHVDTPTESHAAVWRGSTASYRDLGPAGGSGTLYATTGSVHVGQGVLVPGGLARALINFDSPTSWTDLRQFLPPQYTGFSKATSVYQDGDTIYVGGYATDSSGHHNAILWIGRVCSANCDGSTVSPVLTANDFQCFINLYAAANPAANCDQSTGTPMLTANDFMCFMNKFATGCS